ncbi:hypothetical protein QP185_01620 [Sphingomonas aerolata]
MLTMVVAVPGLVLLWILWRQGSSSKACGATRRSRPGRTDAGA